MRRIGSLILWTLIGVYGSTCVWSVGFFANNAAWHVTGGGVSMGVVTGSHKAATDWLLSTRHPFFELDPTFPLLLPEVRGSNTEGWITGYLPLWPLPVVASIGLLLSRRRVGSMSGAMASPLPVPGQR